MRRLGRPLIAAYGAGAFGALLGFGVVPLLFLYYLTEVTGLPPVWAGMLLAIPKIADMVLDPLIGRRTDAYAARHGGRGSLLAFSLATLPVLLVLIFMPMTQLPLSLRMTVLGVLLVAQSLLTTVFQVAHTALSGDLTQTLEDRGTLLASRAFGSSVAGLVVSALAPSLVAAFGQGQRGYLGMSAVLAALSAGLLLITWLTCRAAPMRAGVASAIDGKGMHILRALRLSLLNTGFYSITLMLVMIGTGAGTLIALMPYINQFVLGGSPEQLPRLLMPVFVALLTGVVLAPTVLRRLGPGRAMFTSLVFATVGVELLAGGSRTMGVMVCGAASFGFGAGLLNVFITTLATHSATLDHGRAETPGLGLYLGVLFSAEKLGASAGGVLAGLALDWAKSSPIVTTGAGAMKAVEAAGAASAANAASAASAAGAAPAAQAAQAALAAAAYDPARLTAAWHWIPMLALAISYALLLLNMKRIARLATPANKFG